MSRIEKLLPASWKGIPFFVRSEILTEGGRRIALHDYPNSSERFVEDLGELPPSFSVTAFVTGEDFLERADQLERALKEPGKGRLSMPTFGSKILFAMPYRKDSSQTEVGEIKFELSFVAGRSISGPTQASKTIQTVFSQGDEARIQIADALKRTWIVPKSSSNALTASFDLNQTVSEMKKILSVVTNATDVIRDIEFIEYNRSSIVRDGDFLSSSLIKNLWQTVSVGMSGGSGIADLISLTRFGSQLSLLLSDIKNAYVPQQIPTETETIPLWDETTAERIERNKNRLAQVNASRVAALVSAYEQAADASYDTDIEIDQTRSALEAEHQRLMRVDTKNKLLVQSQPQVRRAIEKMRLSALDLLNQKEQSAYSLTTIETQSPISSFVLTYDLYAEEFQNSEQLTEKTIDVRALNKTQPADKLNDSITVFQA